MQDNAIVGTALAARGVQLHPIAGYHGPLDQFGTRPAKAVWRAVGMNQNSQTRPIHLRSSHTALSDVIFRESRICPAALSNRPFFAAFQASLALMATN